MKEYVKFESHTHPILTKLTDKELGIEFNVSKAFIKNNIDPDCLSIAYQAGDYDEKHFKIMKQDGYQSGRTTETGWNDFDTDIYKLKSIGISDNADIYKFEFQLSGIFGFICKI